MRVLAYCLVLITFVGALQYSTQLVGSGSTFAQPLYEAWAYGYEFVTERNIKVQYSGVGSGRGKDDIINKRVDFAGSDAEFTPAEALRVNNTIRVLPVVASAVVLPYNVPELLRAPPIVLSREAVVGIFNGTISVWNHPTLVALNPLLANVNRTMTLVYRRTSSGTTEIFTRALSAFSREYASRFGVTSTFRGSMIASKIETTSNTASLVSIQTTPYSIGYVAKPEWNNEVPIASVINSANKTVNATTEAVQVAIDYFTQSNALVVSLIDSPEPDAYPICGFTYILVYNKSSEDCEKKKLLLDYIIWSLREPVALDKAEFLNYAPLPTALRHKVIDTLYEVQCNNRAVLLLLERNHISIIVITSIIIVLALLCSFFWCCNKELSIIRRSQQIMMQGMIIATILGSIGVMFLSLPSTRPLCFLEFWFSGLGYTMFFSCLFIKSYRVFKIFNNSMSRVRVQTWKQIVFVLLNMAFEIFINSLWNIISPFQVVDGKCTSTGYIVWAFIWGLNKVILLVACVIMAFLTTRVSDYYNESKWLAFIVYNISLCILMFVPVNIYYTYIEFEMKYALSTIVLTPANGALIILGVSFCSMFMPKILHLGLAQIDERMEKSKWARYLCFWYDCVKEVVYVYLFVYI